MSGYNFCLINKNKIYEEIYEMIDDEELSMSRQDDTDKIIYQINKIIKKAKYINIIKEGNTSNELLEEIMNSLINENSQETQGNTLLLHANDDYYYETIYLENLINPDQKEDDVNQLVTISNIELEPITMDAVIVKTGYIDGNPVCKLITMDDIGEIIINNFYHTGIIINEDGSLLELKYSGDNPTLIIGNKFQKGDYGDVLGITMLPWIEPSEKENKVASKLLGMEIKGRIFLMTFCPITNKKHWSLTKQTVENILKILDDKEKTKKLYEEIDKQSKQTNPFYLIKKLVNS
jgi:hypothetical protein